jgi:hypothetical protein
MVATGIRVAQLPQIVFIAARGLARNTLSVNALIIDCGNLKRIDDRLRIFCRDRASTLAGVPRSVKAGGVARDAIDDCCNLFRRVDAELHGVTLSTSLHCDESLMPTPIHRVKPFLNFFLQPFAFLPTLTPCTRRANITRHQPFKTGPRIAYRLNPIHSPSFSLARNSNAKIKAEMTWHGMCINKIHANRRLR